MYRVIVRAGQAGILVYILMYTCIRFSSNVSLPPVLLPVIFYLTLTCQS